MNCIWRIEVYPGCSEIYKGHSELYFDKFPSKKEAYKEFKKHFDEDYKFRTQQGLSNSIEYRNFHNGVLKLIKNKGIPDFPKSEYVSTVTRYTFENTRIRVSKISVINLTND